jgi:hypothetical protein
VREVRSKMARTMKLKIVDRINILQVLPTEESFATLKIVRKIVENVGLTDADFKEYEIKEFPEENRMVWNEDNDVEKEFTFGEKSYSIIRDALIKLDKDKKITNQFYSTYEKFVGDDEEEEGVETEE